MTQVKNSTASDTATEGIPPFHGRVADVMMVDKTQAKMFAALGRARSLFQEMSRWPDLRKALARRSHEYLGQVGEDRWAAAGGVHGPDGSPSCLLTSPLAGEVVRSIAADPGGLLWTDSAGVAWAVRLVPTSGRDCGDLFGFALSWPVVGVLGEPAPSSEAQADTTLSLQGRARQLRLAARAEQLLWAIHWAVLNQNRSVVLLPDVLLGQVVWGGDTERWPQDWRGDLMHTLYSLTDLRLEVLRLSSEGWRPRLGMHSVAVATVEQLWVTRPKEDYCRPCCPMWGSSHVHRHLAIQAGYGFLGAMEHFAVGEEATCRSYDFKTVPDTEAGEELLEARNSGRMVSISAPTALFGPAKWSGLSDGQRAVIQALFGEVTRPIPPATSTRPDHAYVGHGNKVSGLIARSRVACPMLDARGRYVAFNGNGKRWGMGYLIVGVDGRGWLEKCGHEVPAEPIELGREIRSFLGHLQEVGEVLGLTVAGLTPGGDWLELSPLIAMARTRHNLEKLLAVHLRVYGPENYLGRCRAHLSETGHFGQILGGDSDGDGDGHGDNQPDGAPGFTDLATRIRMAGIRQADLAKALEVSQPYVSRLMTGNQQWPERHRQRAEAMLTARTEMSATSAQ